MALHRRVVMGWGLMGATLAGLILGALLLIEDSVSGSSWHKQQCTNSFRNLGFALVYYASKNGAYPPGTYPGSTLPPEQRVSWLPLLTSYGDEYQGVEQLVFDTTRPWGDEENRVPQCKAYHMETGQTSLERFPGPPHDPFPSRHDIRTSSTAGMAPTTSFIGIAGLGTDAPVLPSGHRRAGVFGYDRRTRPNELKDGASNTLMVVESSLDNRPWTAGGPATVRGLDPGRQPYIGRGRQFGGWHRGGANAAFTDGSVRFLRESIDPRVFEALSTIAGGETLPGGWSSTYSLK